MQGIDEAEKSSAQRPFEACAGLGVGPVQVEHPCTDERLTVRLHKILRAPWAVPPGERYRVIGTVHRGMEFGFLAVARSGGYLQVNGSVVQPLNRQDVDAAIGSSSHFPAARPADTAAMERPAGPVMVIRKKRRIPADAAAALMAAGLP